MKPTQTWSPRRYRAEGGFVARLGRGVVDLLDPRSGERILDIGCGDGTLSAEIAAKGAHVVGIDQSPEQVEAAKTLGIDARYADVRRLSFESEFDAAFSNAALHWVPDADTAARRIHRALKPGGRFVGEMGGAGNVAHLSRAVLSALASRGIDGMTVWPWYFPTVEEYTAVLERAGFDLEHAELFDRPTPIAGRLAEWLEVFATPFIDLVAAPERPSFLADFEAAAAPALRSGNGDWSVDYVRLRFAARKPGTPS